MPSVCHQRVISVSSACHQPVKHAIRGHAPWLQPVAAAAAKLRDSDSREHEPERPVTINKRRILQDVSAIGSLQHDHAHLLQPVALSGTQWHSVALSGTQWQSIAINRNQSQSIAINGSTRHHASSGIRGGEKRAGDAWCRVGIPLGLGSRWGWDPAGVGISLGLGSRWGWDLAGSPPVVRSEGRREKGEG